MNKRSLLAGALSASLLAGALPGLVLAQEEEAVLYPIEGVQWQLHTLAGGDVPEGVEVTLFMNGGNVNGNAGCNSYFGSYVIDATSLTFPDPFGSTRMMCEEPAQSVEDQYLPTLQATAGWTVDEEGQLVLTDADGNETLVFGEPPVEITATDIEALAETLANLQAQIDQAEAEVAALATLADSIDVNRFNRRLNGVDERVTQLEKQVGSVNVTNLRSRVVALEETTARLDRTIDRFRDRILALEESDKAQNRRIRALEDLVPVPSPASE